eukprot:TRINITY_DN7731_c0_g1_i2.p1 TRINITY_DN7731_c0_g1~~TRINITY_DN7731_c0_g1_i2.p1  ORF type:complete len:278 (-),score=-24.20 TRINITY_DN7731_c0_g1_i2:216-1049(-)
MLPDRTRRTKKHKYADQTVYVPPSLLPQPKTTDISQFVTIILDHGTTSIAGYHKLYPHRYEAGLRRKREKAPIMQYQGILQRWRIDTRNVCIGGAQLATHAGADRGTVYSASEQRSLFDWFPHLQVGGNKPKATRTRESEFRTNLLLNCIDNLCVFLGFFAPKRSRPFLISNNDDHREGWDAAVKLTTLATFTYRQMGAFVEDDEMKEMMKLRVTKTLRVSIDRKGREFYQLQKNHKPIVQKLAGSFLRRTQGKGTSKSSYFKRGSAETLVATSSRI